MGHGRLSRRGIAERIFPHPLRIGTKPGAFSRREKAEPCNGRKRGMREILCRTTLLNSAPFMDSLEAAPGCADPKSGQGGVRQGLSN